MRLHAGNAATNPLEASFLTLSMLSGQPQDSLVPRIGPADLERLERTSACLIFPPAEEGNGGEGGEVQEAKDVQ